MRFGYACQNLTIPETTNRTLRLANLADAEKVRSIVTANLAGLRQILHWNATHGIGLFRIGQSFIPFASHAAFPYDWRGEHGEKLSELGRLAIELGIRLSMHPGQFIQPGSQNPDVVTASLAELRYCVSMFDLIGVPDAVVVLHLGGAYGEPAATAARFVSTLAGEDAIRRYIALENDERIWTSAQVSAVASALGVPSIVDTLHQALNPGEISLDAAIALAADTWPTDRRQKVHISSQDPAKQAGAHAFGIDPADLDRLVQALAGRDVDVMVEAKGKEQALLAMGTAAS